ncbi:MAG: hypothetical protein JST12_07270 [Armatimonadetes bacterium]|nr:hypothetical protein [Armatimonadota bacterium]
MQCALAIALSGSLVSIHNPGIRLELFLKEFSKQTGEIYECSPQLRDEVLAASFDSQSAEVLKRQLACIIHASWEKRTNRWWLAQTDEQKKEERQWMQNTRNTILQMEFDEFKGLTPTTDWTANDAVQFQVETKAKVKQLDNSDKRRAWNSEHLKKGPEGRFFAALVNQLSPSMLKPGNYHGQVSVYSTNGLPNQLNLPIKMDQALARYRNDLGLQDQVLRRGLLTSDIWHYELECSNSEIPDLVVTLFDRKWKARHVYSNLDWNPDVLIAEGEDFPISSETKSRLASAYGKDPGDISTKTLEDIYTAFANATQQDPLGIIDGRCWMEFASFKKMPLLVNLQEVWDLQPSQYVPKPQQNGFKVGMTRVDANGWILGRPRNPLLNRLQRFDRSTLEKAYSLVKEPAKEDLTAKLALQEILCYEGEFTSGIPHSTLIAGFFTLPDWLMGALGTLTPDQLKDCLTGNTLPVLDLSDRAKAYLETALDNWDVDLSVPYFQGFRTCPRYQFPNGIATMRLGASIGESYEFAFDEPIDEYINLFPTEDFAEMVRSALEENPEFLDKSFKVVKTSMITATAYVGSQSMSREMTFEESKAKTSPKSYTWKTLPKPIKDRVLVKIKKIDDERGG